MSTPEKVSYNVLDSAPEDKRQLTLKNLDTGEEFIIGENDPDFEFDTFELTGDYKDDEPSKNHSGGTRHSNSGGIFAAIYEMLFPKKSNRKNNSNNNNGNNNSSNANNNSSNINNIGGGRNDGGGGGYTNENRPKTPFTKLSSFKFRKELGRGAFGRVLLAEAKTDGKLYALKIISKKNMRSSDKKQAKAERDILVRRHNPPLQSSPPSLSSLSSSPSPSSSSSSPSSLIMQLFMLRLLCASWQSLNYT
jgi:hypothetical protein